MDDNCNSSMKVYLWTISYFTITNSARFLSDLPDLNMKFHSLLFLVYNYRRVRSTTEGNVLTRVCLSIYPSICLSTGGYPYPIMLCNISQNAMGQLGGYPARSSQGGTLAGGVPWPRGTLQSPARGGTLARGVPWPGGTLAGGYPGWGVLWLGGYPGWGGTLAGGVPCRGGTQLGQYREYLLHGGRYASCVHAGGLSCFIKINTFLQMLVVLTYPYL